MVAINLQSLWMSFAVIVISEIGDKTFLIAAVMAMTNPRLVIFSAAISALAVMTVLSALFGHFLPNLISKEYTQFAAAALFVVFGVKMLYDGIQMTDNEGQEELDEVTAELVQKDDGERDDALEKGKEKPDENWATGARNIANLFFSAVWIQTFVLTFLAEWGDRSQIATIALAGAEDFWWVTIGSLAGHAICSAVAVIGGRLLASKISVRTVTILGSVIFIICGLYSFYVNLQVFCIRFLVASSIVRARSSSSGWDGSVGLSNISTREDAERKLESLARESFAQYMYLLCQELSSEATLVDIRRSAGLAMKNALSAKDEGIRAEFTARWIQMEVPVRKQIKDGLLATLSSPVSLTGFAAAQVIAAIGAIELPHNQWPDLIAILVHNVEAVDSNTKEATLQAIGFICETIHPVVLQELSNQILTAVVQCARKEETNQKVRLAALRALLNSLEFAKRNFEHDGERNYIMLIVCEGTVSADEDVQVAAFECLVKIVQLYYDKMQSYMSQALYGLTIDGMQNLNERVAMQSVEFWSTVCEEEANIIQENQISIQNGEQPMFINYNFAQPVGQKLVSVLLFLLTKKEEDEDEDDWNISMAAATCLALLSTVFEDNIIGLVLPWVQTHLQSPDWKFREGAVMAFGSILDGPKQSTLAPLVGQALPFLITMMNDPNVQVKDTTAWTLGRISEMLTPETIKPEQLHALISGVVAGLNDHSRVASNCAWCIINLAEHMSGEETDVQTYPLSPYFDGLITSLLTSVNEKSNHEANLKATVYEAIATLVSTCAKDCFGTVEKLAHEMLNKLNGTIAMQREIVSQDDRSALQELQANICSVLTNIIRRMSGMINPIADPIMMCVLNILSSSHRSSTVLEDAFIVISALSSAVEGDFIRYMNDFNPHLIRALQNPQDHQLSAIAVGMIGDICRSLNEQILPFCRDYMTCLVENLKSPILDRSVKPSILSCFGDLAIAIAGEFEAFIEPVMAIVDEAIKMVLATPVTDDRTYDQIDYTNLLREGIIEAYVGITQGLAAGQKAHFLGNYVERMFMFMETIQNDVEHSEAVATTMAGLIGDLADAFPEGHLARLYSMPFVEKLLKELKRSYYNQKAQELARWARSRVKRQLIQI
ncbi:UNVERIFIED_CONTAM: karyopherin beta [Siphonaria sp. JEL0065]|nr:karyopherin beta [Siphonaria sp. JEL0065]